MKELKHTNEPVSVGNNFLAENKRLNQLYDKVKAKDPYARLELKKNATEAEIKEAYARKVNVFNPNQHPEEFKDMNQKILALYWEAEVKLLSEIKSKNTIASQSKPKVTLKLANALPRTLEENLEFDEHKRQKAIKEIEFAATQGIYAFQGRRNLWVQEKIITPREANSLPGVKSSAIQDLERAVIAGVDVFKTKRNGWMKSGVITKNEAKEIWRRIKGK